MRHLGFSLFLLCVLPHVATANAPECPRADTPDRIAIRVEVACLLSHYVQLDTTNPPGNEALATIFLKRVLDREGIPSQVFESAPGRANLVARLPGRGASGAVALIHHTDVVSANPDEWSVAPFAGEIRDGFLWGRGAIDNKGTGMVGLVSMLLLHRMGDPLARDLVLVAVADEETGGAYGARWLLREHPELWSDIEFILGEGGAIISRRPGHHQYSVELAQKAPLWLRLTTRGTPGHGSSPSPDAAPHVLVRALARLEAHRFPIEVIPEVQRVFTQRAAAMPEDERGPFLDLATALRDPEFRTEFLENRRNATLVRHSLAITQLSGSDKENVIPGSASAVLDMRILPGHDPQDIIAEVVRVMDEPRVEVETILSWEGHAAPRDTALFRAIEAHAARRHPGAPVSANFIAGFTDCNAFRRAGITCYGFSPVVFTPADFPGVHGRDERVALDALADGVLGMIDLLRGLPSGDPGDLADPD